MFVFSTFTLCVVICVFLSAVYVMCNKGKLKVQSRYLMVCIGICDLERRSVMNIAINCVPIIVCKSSVKNISTG